MLVPFKDVVFQVFITILIVSAFNLQTKIQGELKGLNAGTNNLKHRVNEASMQAHPKTRNLLQNLV